MIKIKIKFFLITTSLIFYSFSSYSQNKLKVSNELINCFLNEFDLLGHPNNIDSLILNSKKYSYQFLREKLMNKDTIFVKNKTYENNLTAVKLINNYYIKKFNFDLSESDRVFICINDSIKNKDNISILRGKKHFLIKIFLYYDNINILLYPTNKGLVVYEYGSSAFNNIKYVYKNRELIKITLSNSYGSLSIFLNKNLTVKKIFFTNTDYLSCLSEYKRIFYNGKKLKIK